MDDTEHRSDGEVEQADGEERRRSPRLPASHVPQLRARLLAGPEVSLVDVSRRGVLVETDVRLMPGSPIRVKFVTEDATLVLKGAVVRSTVARVTDTGMRYRTAVAFEEDISLCDPSIWEHVPPVAAEAPPAPVSTLSVAPAIEAPAPEPEPGAAATVITLFASSSEEFRSLLAANDW